MVKATVVANEDGSAHVSIHQSGQEIKKAAKFPSREDARLALLADGWQETESYIFMLADVAVPPLAGELRFCEPVPGDTPLEVVDLHCYPSDGRTRGDIFLRALIYMTTYRQMCVVTKIGYDFDDGDDDAADLVYDPLVRLLSGGIVRHGALGPWMTRKGAELGIKQVLKQLEETYGRVFLYEALYALAVR